MQLQPRYGTDPIIVLDGPPADVLAPMARQRQRLAQTLATFDAHQWAHPTRCAGWTTRDVVLHLDSTNAFWSYAVAQGQLGTPSQLLATFDPVASPARLVVDEGEVPVDVVLDRFTTSTDALVDQLTALDDAAWSTLAEAPPGHVSTSALAHHALWDAWVHERDILLPLGLTPVVEADEVAACLRYGAALGPAFVIERGDLRTGSLTVSVTDPDLGFTVTIDGRAAVSDGADTAEAVLRGDAVAVLEALSIRGPFPEPAAAEHDWMLQGLATTFDQG